MSTGVTPEFSQGTASKRSVPRYKLTVPLALTVLRSGIPNNIPGRTVEIGEGGMGVVPSSQLLVGEFVRIEFLIPHMSSPVRATAVVRHQRERCFGLQFLRLSAEQQSIVRYWTRREGELSLTAQAGATLGEAVAKPKLPPHFENSENSRRKFGIRRIVAFAVSITAITAALGWWQWQQEWAELEAQLPTKEPVVVQPQLDHPPGHARISGACTTGGSARHSGAGYRRECGRRGDTSEVCQRAGGTVASSQECSALVAV